MSTKIMRLLLTIGIMFLFPLQAHASEIKAVPVVSQFKTFMDYRTITDRRSKQWALQTTAQTDPNGLRTCNGRFLVAVGSYFTTNVGENINVYLDDGTVLPCTVGDAKNDKHTINGHSTGTHNDVVEFIVDQYNLYGTARKQGDISYVPGFSGRVTAIETGVSDTQNVTEALNALSSIPEEEMILASTDVDETISVGVSTEDQVVVETLSVLTDTFDVNEVNE